jgi:hypothetical protein
MFSMAAVGALGTLTSSLYRDDSWDLAFASNCRELARAGGYSAGID